MNGIYYWERIERIMMETKDSLFNFFQILKNSDIFEI